MLATELVQLNAYILNVRLRWFWETRFIIDDQWPTSVMALHPDLYVFARLAMF